MYTLIADSGSTKTAWMLRKNKTEHAVFTTRGINPFILDDCAASHIIEREVLPALSTPPDQVTTLRFYGAGCRDHGIERMKTILQNCFPAAHIEVASDLLCAARALCAGKRGIACILGTGSNSCLYDGRQIVTATPALGFILGDEGSGAVLGRRLTGDLYKGVLPADLRQCFEQETGQDLPTLIENVYRATAPNRYLASFTHFISRHILREELHEMVVEEFCRFLRRNIADYDEAHELPVHFVGGVAFAFTPQLTEALHREEYHAGEIIQAPLSRAENL